MAFRSLLYREWRWLRRHAVTVVLVLVVLPSLFGFGTGAFQQVVPRDTPVAVVPGDATVTEDEMNAITGVAALFSRPRGFEADERERAMRALDREEVYAVLVVPPGVLDSERSVTVEMYVDAAIVPYEQPSIAIASILGSRLGDVVPADVRVERITVGTERTLSEYLFTVGTILLAMVVALAYVPYVVAGERRVFPRIRIQASLGQYVTAKLLAFSVLMVVPLAAFAVVARVMGFDVDPLAPGALVVTLVTFVFLAAIGLAVMFLTRFRTVGRMINVAFLFGLLVFSGLVYPVGFFSPLRRDLARSIPLHYSMTAQRGVALKEHSLWLYGDHLLVLLGTTAVSIALLAGAIWYYQRRGYHA